MSKCKHACCISQAFRGSYEQESAVAPGHDELPYLRTLWGRKSRDKRRGEGPTKWEETVQGELGGFKYREGWGGGVVLLLKLCSKLHYMKEWKRNNTFYLTYNPLFDSDSYKGSTLFLSLTKLKDKRITHFSVINFNLQFLLSEFFSQFLPNACPFWLTFPDS